jgi:hypothetical protein
VTSHFNGTGPTLATTALWLSVRRVGRGLAWAAVFLVVMGLVVLYPKYVMGHDYVYGLVPKFDLNGEMNAPTWFSSSVTFVAALVDSMGCSADRSGTRSTLPACSSTRG